MYQRWTDSELETLDRVYPTGGSRAVHPLLPDRSMDAIKSLARWRGLKFIGRRAWPGEETSVALANYPTLGAERTALLLPGRSPQDRALHANIHGVFRQFGAVAA